MSTYQFVELVGTSSNSWEDAAKQAIEDAKLSGLKEMRVAEVDRMDVKIMGAAIFFRVRLKVSYKVTGVTSAGPSEFDEL